MLTAVIRKYQSYDPATGRFDKARSLREYGALLGVPHTTLANLYAGRNAEPSAAVLKALARTFPAAAADLARALVQDEPA